MKRPYTSLAPNVEAAIWKVYTNSIVSAGTEVELWCYVGRMKHRRYPKYDHISQVLPSKKVHLFTNLQKFKLFSSFTKYQQKCAGASEITLPPLSNNVFCL